MQGNCPSGYFSCYPGADPDHKICVQSTNDCPITDINIVSTPNTNPNYTYNRIPYPGQELYLAFSKNTPTLPIITTVLAEN